MSNFNDKFSLATERAKIKIAKFTKFSCDFGDKFLNNLFYGTLETLIDRVNSKGFCEVCWGEESGAKRYGIVHYTRDACECALALISCGIFPVAKRILDFTLRNLPDNQSYFPQTYNSDGSPADNFTIATDRTGHVIRGCYYYLRYTRDINFIEKHFNVLARMTNYLKKYYHPSLHLVDSGNYNEQLDGSREPLCDLYTNCSILNGYRLMGKLSSMVGKKDIAEDCKEMAEKIKTGIEKNLKGEYYFTGIRLNKERLPFAGWINMMPLEWYEDCDKKALENAYKLNMEKTTIKWEQYKIPSGLTDDYYCGKTHIAGKVLGYFTGYMAETGRLRQLQEMMNFIKEFTVKPKNIYPENWWYCRMKDYKMDKFLRKWWTPYIEDPNGDYTIDSGNCEQDSCWLFDFLKHIVGIKEYESELVIKPCFPFNHKKIVIKNYPLSGGDRISYSLFREVSKVKLEVGISKRIKYKIQIPVPKEENITKVWSRTKVRSRIFTQNDVKWIEISFSPLPFKEKKFIFEFYLK